MLHVDIQCDIHYDETLQWILKIIFEMEISIIIINKFRRIVSCALHLYVTENVRTDVYCNVVVGYTWKRWKTREYL